MVSIFDKRIGSWMVPKTKNVPTGETGRHAKCQPVQNGWAGGKLHSTMVCVVSDAPRWMVKHNIRAMASNLYTWPN